MDVHVPYLTVEEVRAYIPWTNASDAVIRDAIVKYKLFDPIVEYDCQGWRCRKWLEFEETGVWCECCHGDYSDHVAHCVRRASQEEEVGAVDLASKSALASR